MENLLNIIVEEIEPTENSSNAEKIGMSLEDLALVDEDFEFGNIEFTAKPIKL